LKAFIYFSFLIIYYLEALDCLRDCRKFMDEKFSKFTPNAILAPLKKPSAKTL